MEKELTREQASAKRPQPSTQKARSNAKTDTRTASDEEFRKAHAKTTKAHSGLFRRLAQ